MSCLDAGSKYDEGKPELLKGTFGCFPRALVAVGTVSTFGARKYDWYNWRKVPNGVDRYSDAMVRHLARECAGEARDAESGALHAAHTAWNALCRLELMLMMNEEREKDVSERSGAALGEVKEVDTAPEPTRKGTCQCGAKNSPGRA